MPSNPNPEEALQNLVLDADLERMEDFTAAFCPSKNFNCQNGRFPLFGQEQKRWRLYQDKTFIKAIQKSWDTWR